MLYFGSCLFLEDVEVLETGEILLFFHWHQASDVTMMLCRITLSALTIMHRTFKHFVSCGKW
eukprot:c36182_g1_i1 orf=100-285(+)